jgi:hypothetical protein
VGGFTKRKPSLYLLGTEFQCHRHVACSLIALSPLRISTQHAVGLYWVPGHAGVKGNEIADKLARSGSVQRSVGPEPFLGVSRQDIRIKLKRWMEKHHLVLWCGMCSI